jgi:hypothetical protein
MTVGSAGIMSCHNWQISPVPHWHMESVTLVERHLELLQPPLETRESNTFNQ